MTQSLAPGFGDELKYWDRELSMSGSYPDAIRKRTSADRMIEEFPHYLMPYFDGLRSAAAPNLPNILDVGSGPLSMLAWGHVTRLFDLTAVDPLADRYLELLGKHGHSPNCRLVQGYGEDLAAIFEGRQFDMVWIHNALDHSQSPANVVRAMATVVRPGGYLVIQGWSREGTAEGWNGLHQHDLYLTFPARLCCQSRGGEPLHIDQGLSLEVVDWFVESIVRDWIRIIYRKANEL